MSRIVTHWKQNRGNWLFAIAVGACVFASIGFHFGWLPDIRLRPPSDRRGIVQGRGSGVVVVTVVTPKVSQGLNPMVVVGLLPALGKLGADADFFSKQQHPLPSNGVLTMAFPAVPSGHYAAVAFVDRNANGKLDFLKNGNPAEPFRLSFPATDPPAGQLDLDDAAFEVRGDRPAVLMLDFTQSVHTETPAGDRPARR